MQATHELAAGSIKRQVWEEESECGGDIFPDNAILDLVPLAASNQANFVPAEEGVEPNATTYGNVPGIEEVFPEKRGSSAEPRSQRNFTAAPTYVEAFYTVPSWVNEYMELPKPELMNFDGEPTQYPRFISNFDVLITRE